MLRTPGHTPGHQSLLVRLRKAGTLVLSGDVAHFCENFRERRVPTCNANHDKSLHSMDRVEEVVRSEHAQLLINHDARQSRRSMEQQPCRVRRPRVSAACTT